MPEDETAPLIDRAAELVLLLPYALGVWSAGVMLGSFGIWAWVRLHRSAQNPR